MFGPIFSSFMRFFFSGATGLAGVSNSIFQAGSGGRVRLLLAEGCDVQTLYICRMVRNRFWTFCGEILLRKNALKLDGWHEISASGTGVDEL
jgi:hypothetical protein